MSPSPEDSTLPNAELAFRQAFLRLAAAAPERLPRGTPVTQNNVAREAGRDPSALKKSRHPRLVAEIQNWIAAQTTGQKSSAQTRPRSSCGGACKERLAELKAQRDQLASLLVESDARILELTMECEHIRALINPSKVVDIAPGTSVPT